jgi:predicted nucleotide-binding protein
MMDRQKVIELLKQKSKEAVYVASLPYTNNEYLPWRRNIEDILESAFGVTSTEYKRVADVHIETTGTREAIQRAYIALVHTIQQEVDSIIQKYEILGLEVKPATIVELAPKAFISHGKESVALTKLEEFLSTLGIETLIVKERPSLDKTVNEKVNYYLEQADFVVVLATGDDEFEGKLHPRQNVIHEIGLAQKTYQGRIIYLLEEGTEFPSNIRPKVWESFKQRNMMNAFLGIVRELRAYGMLKVFKSQE